jgi:hypothetical protein
MGRHSAAAQAWAITSLAGAFRALQADDVIIRYVLQIAMQHVFNEDFRVWVQEQWAMHLQQRDLTVRQGERSVRLDTPLARIAPHLARLGRYVPAVCLSLLLPWGSIACTLKSGESFALSARGEQVSLQVSEPIIFFGLPDPRYPQTTEVVVRVRDVQGQPVDGMTVLFSVEPSWTPYASLTPAEVRTRLGEAWAVFAAKTTGVVPIMARVDTVTLGAAITVERRPTRNDAGG